MPASLLSIAVEASRAGARALTEHPVGPGLASSYKARNDLVTAADRASEAAILEVIERRRPQDAVLAEESGARGPGGGLCWVVDPLDGTVNYAHGLPFYAVAVAVVEGGLPVAGVVLDPARDLLYSAERGGGATCNGVPLRGSQRDDLEGSLLATGFPFRAHAALDPYLECFRRLFLAAGGVRRCGAAALDLAGTAAGVYDGFFEFQLAPWDIAAGQLLVEEAGGCLTDLDGQPGLPAAGNVVAGSPGVHARMLEILGEVVDEASLRSWLEGG